MPARPWIPKYLTDLFDVLIDNPIVDQVLRYNGLKFVNANPVSVSAGKGVTFYFDDTDIIPPSSHTVGVETLASVPAVGVEDEETLVVNNNTVVFDMYLSAVLGRTVLDAGTWDWHLWRKVSDITDISSMLMSVLVNERHHVGTVAITGSGTSRTATVSGATPFTAASANADITLAGGLSTPTAHFFITGYISPTEVTIECLTGYVNETAVAYNIGRWLFCMNTGEINETFITEQSITSVQPEHAILATDMLAVHIFGRTDSLTDKTLYFYHGGEEHYSHIDSPLNTKHNDLAGIQGGAANDNYHLTLSELEGLTDGGETVLHSHSGGGGEWEDIGAAFDVVNAAYVPFQGLDNTYRDYRIISENINMSISSGSLGLQYEIGGAFITTGSYYYAYHKLNTSDTYKRGNATAILMTDKLSSFQSAGNTFKLIINNPSQAAGGFVPVNWYIDLKDSTIRYNSIGSGTYQGAVTAPVTGVRLLIDGVKTITGRFQLQGRAAL